MLLGFTSNQTVISIYICATFFVTSLAANATYLITFDSFPTNYISSLFGILQLIGRLFALLVPSIYEIDMPIPIIIFSLVCLGTAIISKFGLNEKQRI